MAIEMAGFSTIQGLVLRGKDHVCQWWKIPADICSSSSCLALIKTVLWSLFLCILALGGATVGVVTGALKGQTTETGLFRGAAVGSVAGAITAVQLFELMLNGEPFSKVALVCSLVDGKIFMDWVCPAMLKAYQWQVDGVDTNLREISDIFDTSTPSRGLACDIIQKLPKYRVKCCNKMSTIHQDLSCPICLQEFENGEYGRALPSCKHSFHLQCIDQWLIRHGTCPICRLDVF